MDDTVVTVATYYTPLEAELARNQLDSKGIRSTLMDAETVAIAWHLGPAVGGIKLQVRQADVEGAQSVLRKLQSPPETDQNGADATPLPDEDLSSRALRSAIFGLVFVPLQLYSWWLLGRLLLRSGSLPSPILKRVVLTVVLDLWIVLFIAIIAANIQL